MKQFRRVVVNLYFKIINHIKPSNKYQVLVEQLVSGGFGTTPGLPFGSGHKSGALEIDLRIKPQISLTEAEEEISDAFEESARHRKKVGIGKCDFSGDIALVKTTNFAINFRHNCVRAGLASSLHLGKSMEISLVYEFPVHTSFSDLHKVLESALAAIIYRVLRNNQ
ncbi:hypothetical protein WAI453_009906 [Rhynchosporium graminicola]